MNATDYATDFQEEEWLLAFVLSRLPIEEQQELEPMLTEQSAEARWELLLEKTAREHPEPPPPPGVFLQIKQQIKQREEEQALVVSQRAVNNPIFIICKYLALAGAGTTLFFLILRALR
jgi:cell division inhibitor SulA